ncbi:MAG: DUF58 domain-containing protein [Methanoregulaceae archaeon]
MKPTRCSQGIVLLTVVLALFSFFFDDLPAAVAAGGLLFFLIARGALFFSVLQRTAGSLAVSRSVSSLFARQGSRVSVRAVVSGEVPPGYFAVVSDLPPEGSYLSAGSATGVVLGPAVLSYTLTPMGIGEHDFSGIHLSFSDLFFRTGLTIRMAGESLTVLPLAAYSLPGRDAAGETEVPHITPLTSAGIREFREYMRGDDPRRIDWKLSAKYDQLWVREYMGRALHSLLLIVDLPDMHQPLDEEVFSRFRDATAGVIADQVQGSRETAVLLISGPNLLSFLPSVSDTGALVAMLRELMPSPRLHHLFRYAPTPVLRARYAHLAGRKDLFADVLTRVTGSFLATRLPTLFEAQVSRVFSAAQTPTTHVFSLALGDASHLRVLAGQAAGAGMDAHLHIPRERWDLVRQKVRGSGFASVEVV